MLLTTLAAIGSPADYISPYIVFLYILFLLALASFGLLILVRIFQLLGVHIKIANKRLALSRMEVAA
ncbi:hypothetical protein [Stomatohabitans albus]|uniref:hypothetical protein n=1 Tax=Stomatohabitans albus TaxID=3110766 RepID=UPI00300DBAB0